MLDGLFNFIGELIKAPFICIGWIILGIVAGWLARKLVGGTRGASCLDLFLGLAGSLVGGFVVGGLMRVTRPDGGLTGYVFSLIVAVIGAVILILIGRLISRSNITPKS